MTVEEKRKKFDQTMKSLRESWENADIQLMILESDAEYFSIGSLLEDKDKAAIFLWETFIHTAEVLEMDPVQLAENVLAAAKNREEK